MSNIDEVKSRFGVFGPQPHVDVTRLAAFLVDGVPLTPAELEHVRQCRQCTRQMAAASAAELQKRRYKSA
jgi:hypothetical protein